MFLRSDDGGTSWTPQALRPPAYLLPSTTLGSWGGCACSTNPPRFTSARVGTFVMTIPGQLRPAIYTTTDCGETWSPRPVPEVVGGQV
ncbi:MAG: beta propeller repeat protein [Candidatus Dormibacteria bacterium]